MTLILTELSEFGIAMAADTASTVDSLNTRGTIESRAFNGLIKLLPVDKLEAGISYWGWSQLPPNEQIGCGVLMDSWLNEFLVRNRNRFDTIEELALLLESELRERVPELSDEELKRSQFGYGGVHLTGFVDYEDNKIPCFWHIHNGESQESPRKDLNPKIVNANYDCPPEKFLRKYLPMGGLMVRNGEYEPYARFFDKYLKKYLQELQREEGIYIPIPTLPFRAEFLRAQILFMSGLYAVGGDYINKEGVILKKARSIGNEVTVLTITAEEGITNYIVR